MNIQKIGTTQSFAPAVILKRLSESVDEGQSLPSSGNNGTVDISVEGQEKLKTLREIMSRYDVRNISYNALKKLGRELFKSGLISGEDECHFTASPIIAGPGTDPIVFERALERPYDVIAFFEERVAYSRTDDPRNLARYEHLLALARDLESFQARG